MFTLIVAGLAALFVIAVVVGVVEQARAGHWRAIAAERRRSWEDRHRQHAGGPEPD